jgi:hypothetical protein
MADQRNPLKGAPVSTAIESKPNSNGAFRTIFVGAPEPELWLIKGHEIGDSSGGPTHLWVLTDHEANVPDVRAAIETASEGRYTLYRVDSITNVFCMEDDDWDGTEGGYAVVNQTGRDLSPEAAAIILHLLVMLAQRMNRIDQLIAKNRRNTCPAARGRRGRATC